MKKKGPRQIPDFSTHRGKPPIVPLGDDKLRSPNVPPPTVKPKATSAKSGRRGQ